MKKAHLVIKDAEEELSKLQDSLTGQIVLLPPDNVDC